MKSSSNSNISSSSSSTDFEIIDSNGSEDGNEIRNAHDYGEMFGGLADLFEDKEVVDVDDGIKCPQSSSTDDLQLEQEYVQEQQDSNIAVPLPLTASKTASSSSSSRTSDDEPENSHSWIESIETFFEEFNNLEVSTSSEEFSEFFLSDSDYNGLITSSESESESAFKSNDQIFIEIQAREEIKALKKGQQFLIYLTIPIILSQFALLLLLTAASNNNTNTPSTVILFHRSYQNPTFIISHTHTEEKIVEEKVDYVYIFFNPLSAALNSKAFKDTCEYFETRSKDPKSIVSSVCNTINAIKQKFNRFHGSIIKKIESGNIVDTAVKLRDNLAKTVLDKVYTMGSSPTYQKAVDTLTNWKNKLFNH